MFRENVEHFNKKISRGAMDGEVEHPIDIKDENEAKYIRTVNPGIKIHNKGRKCPGVKKQYITDLMTGHGRLVNKAI